MTGTYAKKSVQVAVKLAESTFETVERICAAEDRPVGYVVRELMLRGLTAYRTDGRLRDPDSPHKVEDAIHEGIKRAIPRNIGETQKIPVLKGKAK